MIAVRRQNGASRRLVRTVTRLKLKTLARRGTALILVPALHAVHVLPVPPENVGADIFFPIQIVTNTVMAWVVTSASRTRTP